MATVGETETSIKVILFSGERSDWPVWKVKFLSRANRKGYKSLLNGNTPIPEEDELTTPNPEVEPEPTDESPALDPDPVPPTPSFE